jgi:nitroreductase
VRGRGGQRDRQRWAAITDPAQRHQLASCGNHTRPIQAAPLVFALVQEAGGYEFDTGRIAQNIMLIATALGLATWPRRPRHEVVHHNRCPPEQAVPRSSEPGGPPSTGK